MNKIKYIAAALIAIAGLGLQQAKADTFTSDLNVGNSSLAGFLGPFGTVTIQLTSNNTALVTFTANSGYGFIDGGAADLNVNSTNFTATNITDAAFLSTQYFSSVPVDGLGNFNLQINNTAGTGSFVTTISFTLTNLSGTWASAADVLTFNGFNKNGGPFDAAAHITVLATAGAVTGFAGETGGHIVPDGGMTVMLLGVALGALGVVRRYLTC